MDGALTLDLDGWEGPLNPLSALAQSRKLDLRRILTLALVERSLRERAQTLKLEVAVDWLVMAAWRLSRIGAAAPARADEKSRRFAASGYRKARSAC